MRFKNLPDYNEVFGDNPVHVYAVEKINPEIKWDTAWGEPNDCLLGHSDKNFLGDIIINTRTGEVYLFSTDSSEWGISKLPSLQATFKEIKTLQSMVRQSTKNIYKNDMYVYEMQETSNIQDIKSTELQDLAKESDSWVYATAQTFKDSEPLEVLYMPSAKQAGITKKTQTVWTKAESLKNALDRFLGYNNQTLDKLYRRKNFREVA